MCFKPDSDLDQNSSGEGVNSVSSSIKRGLSVDSAQEVKRFRTTTGAISAVRSCAPAVCFLLWGLCFLVEVCSFISHVLKRCGVLSTMSDNWEGLHSPDPGDTQPTPGFSQVTRHIFLCMYLIPLEFQQEWLIAYRKESRGLPGMRRFTMLRSVLLKR